MSSVAPITAARTSAASSAAEAHADTAAASDTSTAILDADQAAFARSMGLPAALGKGTSELKCKVPDVVKDDFARLAHSLGFTESELLREWVMVRLFGEEEVRRMQAQRLAMVSGKGPQ